MEEPIIKVTNISKRYNITHQKGGYVALRDVLTNVAKSPFKFFKHKTKKIIRKEGKEEFWALKNINFEVKKGEVIGIIGANGAGKSTLLKILSQITPPTTGEIRLNGKVGSLLEVGTGFHPELTGRENIMLNGAILGMSKKEIIKKFNDIVEFAGIDKFLDTPVKRYSSGMYVRLAFSVAAHMEPDILIIDEVLAVGDAEFQKKCLGKMNDITKKEGRTILFVSHNLAAIQNLCKRCILLKNGKIETIGETKNTIDKYLNIKSNLINTPLRNRLDRQGEGNIRFTDIKITNSEGLETIKSGDKLTIKLKYRSNFEKDIEDIRISAVLYNNNEKPIFRLDSDLTKKTIKKMKPNGEILCETSRINLGTGIYYFNLAIENHYKLQDYISHAFTLEIKNNNMLYDFTNTNKPNQQVDNIFIAHSFKEHLK